MNFQFIKNLLKNTELKEIFTLPKEWISMFRLLLSMYLIWLIIFTPRKPSINDNILTKYIFTLLLFLMIHTDIISSILLIMIYFFSFQPILPISASSVEHFRNSSKQTPKPTKSDEELEEEKLEKEKLEEEKKQNEEADKKFSQMIEDNLKRNTTPTSIPTPTKAQIKSFTIKEQGNKALGLETGFL